MTPTEHIKLDHYLDGFSYHGQEAGRLNAWDAEARQSLSPHVEALREFRSAKGEERFSADLAELACFLAVSYRRSRGSSPPVLDLSPLSSAELARADVWLSEADRRLRAYGLLPAAERDWLSWLAADLGAEVPSTPEDEPVQFFAALAELRQRHHPDLTQIQRRRVEMYRQLSEEEGHRLASDVISFWKNDPDLFHHALSGANFVEDLLLHLACLVPGSLRGLHIDLIRGGMLDPGELFRDADSAAQDELHRIWVARTGLSAEPAVTTESRPLYHPECYELISVDEADAPDLPGPVQVITSHEGSCGWCGRQLVTLFEIDLSDPRVSFIATGWRRLRIATCERCQPYSELLTDVDGDGGSHWSPLNRASGFLDPDDLDDEGWAWPQQRLVLGRRRRSPYEAHQSILYMQKGASQLGGYPMWVGSEPQAYCPKCQLGMVFIGHLQLWDLFEEGAEGVIYAFLCQDCGMAATTYSQT